MKWWQDLPSKKRCKQEALTVFTWWDCILHRSIGTAAAAQITAQPGRACNNTTVLQAHFCTLNSPLSVTNTWIMHWFSNKVGKLRLIRIGFLSSLLHRDRSLKGSFVGGTDRKSGQKSFLFSNCCQDLVWKIQGHNKPLGTEVSKGTSFPGREPF